MRRWERAAWSQVQKSVLLTNLSAHGHSQPDPSVADSDAPLHAEQLPQDLVLSARNFNFTLHHPEEQGFGFGTLSRLWKEFHN